MSDDEYSYQHRDWRYPALGRLQPLAELAVTGPFARFDTTRLFRHTVDMKFLENQFPEVDGMVDWIESALTGAWQGYAIRIGDKWAYYQRIVRFRFEMEEDAVAFTARFS